MRKCDKKVKKGQGKRRQSNKGNSNDGWVGEEREWIKEDRVTEGTVVTGEMDKKKAAEKEDRVTEGTVVTGEMDRERAA